MRDLGPKFRHGRWHVSRLAGPLGIARRFGQAALVALTALAGSAGCSLPDVTDGAAAAPPMNTCDSDSDCGEGNICTGGRICAATEGEFDTILITVTPSATANTVPGVSGVRFVTTQSGLSMGGNLLLDFQPPTRISATIDPMVAAPMDCTTIPFVQTVVTFTPAERILGLPLKTYSSTLWLGPPSESVIPPEVNVQELNRFTVDLPAGDYEVAVQPEATAEDCAPVPYLLEGVTVGTQDLVTLEIPVVAPQRLVATFLWPASTEQDLEGWIVEMVDSATGHVLSQPSALPSGPPFSTTHTIGTEPALEYRVPIDFAAQVPGRENFVAGEELLRLRPPKNAAGPTMVWVRTGLEALTPGEALIDMSNLAQSVDVQGVVELMETGVSQSADLIFTAKAEELLADGNFFIGNTSTYSVSTETDADGGFDVKLLPGTYTVFATPDPSSGFAATKIEGWSVAPEPASQAGRLVSLGQSRTIRGLTESATPERTPIVGATVQAAASPGALNLAAFSNARGQKPFAPRAGNTITDDLGAFEFIADPGTYDISVRPSQDTGFPWLIRPNVEFSGEENRQLDLEMPLPVVQAGLAQLAIAAAGPPGTLEASGLSGALIRVYVYVDADGIVNDPFEDGSVRTRPGLGVLEVAETRTDDSGFFELLLPSSLN